MTIYNTVGELKKALEGVSDDTPLLTRSRMFGWRVGLVAGTMEVQFIGTKNDGGFIQIGSEEDKIFKNFKRKKPPITGIAFD